MRARSEAGKQEAALNRASLLRLFAEDLDIDYKLEKNSLYLLGHNEVRLDFSSSNYHDENEIELIADVFIKPDGAPDYIYWHDLFHLTKALLKDRKAISFSAQKGKAWKKSKLQKSTLNFYRPLFQTLIDPIESSKFMKGESVKFNGVKLQIKSKYSQALARTSLKIAEKM